MAALSGTGGEGRDGASLPARGKRQMAESRNFLPPIRKILPGRPGPSEEQHFAA